jgi:hypothetical protein
MSGGTAGHGQSSYLGAITAANTAEATTFADRYGYYAVSNLSTTAGQVLYATADGSTPVASGAGTTIAIAPGQTQVIASGEPLWYQGGNAIVPGVSEIPFGNGATEAASSTVTSSPAQPGETLPYMSSGRGGVVNPGGKVTVMSATVSLPYSIEGAG